MQEDVAQKSATSIIRSELLHFVKKREKKFQGLELKVPVDADLERLMVG